LYFVQLSRRVFIAFFVRRFAKWARTTSHRTLSQGAQGSRRNGSTQTHSADAQTALALG
jgi:hypothetical protein